MLILWNDGSVRERRGRQVDARPSVGYTVRYMRHVHDSLILVDLHIGYGQKYDSVKSNNPSSSWPHDACINK